MKFSQILAPKTAMKTLIWLLVQYISVFKCSLSNTHNISPTAITVLAAIVSSVLIVTALMAVLWKAIVVMV